MIWEQNLPPWIRDKVKYYKFVTRDLRDNYSGAIDYSIIGKWITLPEGEVDRNGEACGRGLHLMKVPKPLYFPYAVAYLAWGRDQLGEDAEKARFRSIKLIRQLRFSEIFHPGANLDFANLAGVDLAEANLEGANLYWANLAKANLEGADLEGADLYWANLKMANLAKANLAKANLAKANLAKANLAKANLKMANLAEANLEGANLEGADLEGVKILKGQILKWQT